MYYGHWLYGKKHGKGRLLKTNGEKYSGDFENDKMNGIGELSNSADGEIIFKGSFKND
jgi:hypothetical protein